MTQHGKYPDAYYRVAVKALIRDKDGNVLVVKENSDDWDLPGGGVDHGETFEIAMARELAEEIDYRGRLTMSYIDAVPLYVERMDVCMILTVFGVTLHDEYVPHNGEASDDVRFISPDKFAHATSRMEKMVYKYTRDPATEIPFL